MRMVNINHRYATLLINLNPILINSGNICIRMTLWTHITSHHIEEADAGLDRPLYLRNKCSDKTLKSQKLLI